MAVLSPLNPSGKYYNEQSMEIYLSLALGTLIFSGQVYARVGWGKAPDGTVMSPSSAHWKPPNATSRSDPLREVLDIDGKIDPAKLEAWIVKSQIDPNDPENEELMSRVAEARRKADVRTDSRASAVSGDYFRIDNHMDQFVFGKSEDLDKNLR